MADQPLLSAWKELAVRCKAPPCLDPGWLSCWWPAFGTGEIEIGTLWRQGRLAAVLPMARRQGQLESPANFHTPAFGILAEDEAATASMARELFRDAPARVTFTALDPDGTTTLACREAAEEAGFKVVVRPHLACSQVDLRYGWNEYKRALHGQLLRDLHRGRRQLERMGPLRVEVVSGGEALDERLDESFQVEASGWRKLGHASIRSLPHRLDFYRHMAGWAAGHGVLRLYQLRLANRVLAMYLTLQQHGTCHVLKGGYDAEFRRYSPGNLLMEALLQDCADRATPRVELNCDATSLHPHWTRHSRERVRLEAFAPTLAGRMAWMDLCYGHSIGSRMRQALHLQPTGHRQ